MADKILFETKGMRDAASGGLSAVGFILFLTLMIVSFATKGMVGPWYAHLAGMALCGWIFYAAGNKHSVTVTLTAAGDNNVIISVTGKANNAGLLVEEYSCWYVVTHRSAKHGGKEVRLHLKTTGKSGSENAALYFTKVVFPAVAPKGWTEHDDTFSGQKIFMVDDLAGMVKALGGQ